MDKSTIERAIEEALGGKARVISMGEMMVGGKKTKDGVSLLPEGQIEELQRYAEEYRAGCAFKPGDIVTPKKSGGINGAGLPHVVLEVLEEPVRLWTCEEPSQSGSGLFGRRLDMRVVCYVDNDHVASFWSESYQYEFYQQ